jgi:hypothetical protein
MKELLEKIVAYLPNYFLDCGRLISGPKEFVASKELNSDDAFASALLFAALTVIASFIVHLPFVGMEDMWIKLAIFFILSCVGVCLSALSIMIGWGIVGWRGAPRQIFVITIYYSK